MKAARRFSGKLGVVLLFVVGGGATLWAILFWRDPENSVRWSFTQLHSSLVRGRKEQAAQFVAPAVFASGRERPRDEFLAWYALPPHPGELDVALCPATAGHWTVTMGDLVYCFVRSKNAWQVHWIGEKACGCGERK